MHGSRPGIKGQCYLHINIGPMKAAKTTYIIGEVKMMSKFVNVILLSPIIDTRSSDSIQTHDGHTLECVKVRNLFDIEEDESFKEAYLVLIDEAQFFDDLLSFYKKYQADKSFIVVGLDGKSNQEKFGQVWDLIPYCNSIVKHCGMCDLCHDGTPGIMTVSWVNNKGKILIENVGEQLYFTVCRDHALEFQ